VNRFVIPFGQWIVRRITFDYGQGPLSVLWGNDTLPKQPRSCPYTLTTSVSPSLETSLLYAVGQSPNGE